MDKIYIIFTRINIDNNFKVAMRMFNKNISSDYLSITILEELPKGIEIGKHYSL